MAGYNDDPDVVDAIRIASGTRDFGDPSANAMQQELLGKSTKTAPASSNTWGDWLSNLASQYSGNVRQANEDAASLQGKALENMKSGSIPRMVLGAGQNVLAPIQGVFAPVTGAFETGRQDVEHGFGPHAAAAFDVGSMLVGGPEDIANATRLVSKVPQAQHALEMTSPVLAMAGAGAKSKDIPFKTIGDNIQGASMYEMPPGSDPRYLNAAPDRTEHSLLRFNPPRGTSPRTADALSALSENRNGIKDQMLSDIKAGEALSGSSWYNTEELRDWFVKELGEEKGDKEWREYMHLVGATSTGSKVPSNLGNASYYRNKGPEWVEQNKEALLAGELAPPKGSGYGHKMQSNHAANVANYYTGGWNPEADPRLNPKPRGFIQSLMGSEKNIAADLHFTRYMAMASGSPEWLENSTQISDTLFNQLKDKYGKDLDKYYNTRKVNGKEVINFKPKAAVKDGVVSMEELASEPTVFAGKPNDNEYRAFENYMHELGKELGMTGPQVQANLWMGAAKRTGLADESQGTFMELFRKRAEERAKKEKTTPEAIIRRFIKDRGLLSVAPAGAAGAAAYGMAQPEEQGTFARGGSATNHALELSRKALEG